MADRVGDRHRSALRNAEQRKVFESSRVNDGLEVTDENLLRHLLDLTIGEAVAARVVADQRVVAR